MIRFTKHAQEALSIRDIAVGWIEAAVNTPDLDRPGSTPPRPHTYKAITEHGARVLRVVHRPEGDDIVIITAHFDRGALR